MKMRRACGKPLLFPVDIQMEIRGPRIRPPGYFPLTGTNWHADDLSHHESVGVNSRIGRDDGVDRHAESPGQAEVCLASRDGNRRGVRGTWRP